MRTLHVRVAISVAALFLSGVVLAQDPEGEAPAVAPSAAVEVPVAPAENPPTDVPAASAPADNPPVDVKDDEAKRVIAEMKTREELALSGKGGYNYDPAGRPDPFVNPLQNQGVGDDGAPRPEGWPGMLINEVKLQGITIFGGEPIAMFLGTDDIGYFAREGDELWDGKIEVIDFDEGVVVFKQKVEDPSSPIRHRRVERRLNP